MEATETRPKTWQRSKDSSWPAYTLQEAPEPAPSFDQDNDPLAYWLCFALNRQNDQQLRADFNPDTRWTLRAVVHGVTLTAQPRPIARNGRLDGHEFALRVEGDPRPAFVFTVSDDGTVADLANGTTACLTDEASAYAAAEPLRRRIEAAVLASHVFAPTIA